MKRSIFFDRDYKQFRVNIRYVLDDPTKFQLFDVSRGYIPTQGDTIYLMPGVNIPRSKLKDLALNHGIKIVRDAENANIVITGKATPGKVLVGRWAYEVKLDVVNQYIDASDVDEFYKDNLRTALLSSESDEAYCSYSTVSDIRENKLPVFSGSSSHYYYVEDEWKELIDECQSKVVYDETELLAMINGEDAITITKEVYAQLCEMFSSSDQDNHIMAMEIMANSNYVDSAVYLLLLLEEFCDQVAISNTKNHINFKSMVSYFGIEVKNVQSLDPDKVVEKLAAMNLLTTDWLHLVLESRISWFIGNLYRSRVFRPASLVPTDSIAAAIQSEYRAEVGCDDEKDFIETVIGLNNLSPLVPEKLNGLGLEGPKGPTGPEDYSIGEEVKTEPLTETDPSSIHPFLHEDITEEELTQLATIVSNQDIPAEFNQLITENFSELIDEPESSDNDLYGVDTALTTESVKIFIEAEKDNTQSVTNETLSNNNQINQTNESPGIDWF